MTTVGYGDKAPKRIPGRLFAVVWILVGITITSMYIGGLAGMYPHFSHFRAPLPLPLKIQLLNLFTLLFITSFTFKYFKTFKYLNIFVSYN